MDYPEAYQTIHNVTPPLPSTELHNVCPDKQVEEEHWWCSWTPQFAEQFMGCTDTSKH